MGSIVDRPRIELGSARRRVRPYLASKPITAQRPRRVPVYPGDPATHFPPSKTEGQDLGSPPGPSWVSEVFWAGCRGLNIVVLHFYYGFRFSECQGTSQKSFRAASSRALSRRVCWWTATNSSHRQSKGFAPGRTGRIFPTRAQSRMRCSGTPSIFAASIVVTVAFTRHLESQHQWRRRIPSAPIRHLP